MKKSVLNIYWWLRKHISAVAFATGFVWDTLTLKRIDLLYENFVFITYLLIALSGIFLLHAVETRRFAPKWLLKIRAWLPAIVQFPLGGLFSGFVIFFSKSASLITSWPFLLILFALFIGNEFFRKRYERLIFQMSLFYFALFSYLILVVPIIVKTIGTSTFVFSGILSLLIIGAIIHVIKKLFPKLFEQGGQLLVLTIGTIFIGYNALYFSNTIPPVPLALRDIGIYHEVIKDGNVYHIVYEKPGWYEFWRETAKVYHRTKGESVYCFASVHAPTRFEAEVQYSWQRRDKNGVWSRHDTKPFVIAGGRDGGYRSFTHRQLLDEGVWRCIIETKNKQVIGQVYFNIVDVPEPVTLSKGTK